MEFFQSVWNEIVATSVIEWSAVITGVLYVVLAAKRMMLCWLFAFISSLLYVYLCYIGNLYIESVLQVFYVVMAIVGWIFWQKSKRLESRNRIEIKRWSLMQHLLNVLISGIVAFILGYAFDSYTDQANPYIDAFTTCYSLAATFMVTKKVLGNWIYWIVIDAVSIYLYSARGYQLTAVLYGAFTIIAVFGFIAWYKKWQLQ